MSSLLFPVYKLSRENTLPENMCDIVFEKMKGGGGTERVFTQKHPSEGFFQKGVMRNFAKFTRKHLCRKNETLAQLFSCEFRKLCKNTNFAERHRTTVSDYSSINIRNGKLWYKNKSIGIDLSQKLSKRAV